MTDLILNSFTDVIDSAITDMLAESEYNKELKLAILSTEFDNHILIGDYMVTKKQINIWGSYKNFYMVHNGTDELLFDNICLSYTLIKLLFRLLNNKIVNDNDSLLVLDAKYSGSLADALYYKQRLMNDSGDNDISKSIYTAKYDVALNSLERIKEQIQKIDK